MKKLLSLLMAFLILCCSFTTASFAADGDTATVTVLEDIFTRGNKYGANYYGGATLHVVHDARNTYLKFDISSLRAAMSGKDAKYTLSFATAGDEVNATGGTVHLYGLSFTDWSEADMTHNMSMEYGMYADISNKIGQIDVVGQNKTFTVDISDYIQSLPSDTNLFTIKLENTLSGTTGTIVLHSKEASDGAYAPSISATRTYAENTDAVFGNINIPDVITGDIELPTTGSVYGSSLIWTTSNPEIIALDGTVTNPEVTTPVTLTVTNADNTELKKVYEVIVPNAGVTVTAQVTAIEDTLVRSGGRADANFGTVDNLWVAGAASSYIKFNVSSLKTAMNGKDAKYVLSLTTYSNVSGDVYVYGIDDENRNAWAEGTLTYTMTSADNGNGMDADVLNQLGTISASGNKVTFTLDITDYIKAAPEDGVVTIKLQNKALAETVQFYSKEGGVAEYIPSITATRTFKEATAGAFFGIEIPNVAKENITLPQMNSNDAPITWTSSRPDVIATDGTVTRINGEVLVKLTATIGNETKEFDVIVPKAGETGTAVIDVTENTMTRSGGQGGTVQGGSGLLVIDSSRTTYLKFDVRSLRSDLNGKDAKYTLQFTSHKTENKVGDVIGVYGIKGNNRYDWSESTLTYDIAAEKGLNGDVSCKLGEIHVAGLNVTYTIDVTDYIRTIPEDGIATIKLQNSSSVATVIQSYAAAAGEDTRPKLIAERTYEDNYKGGTRPRLTIDGKDAQELRAGLVAARVAFMNENVTDEPKGTLLIALYNGDALSLVEYVSMDFSSDVVNDMSVSIDVPEGENYNVKAFLLNSLNTLVPLTACAELR